MKFSAFALMLATISLSPFQGAQAAATDSIAKALAPHKAVYDIDLVATHSGSQIINIRGKMTYEWKKSCNAWVTDHDFTLKYDYADGPGMRIASDFSTFESLDGKNFDYTSRRKRDGDMYQEIRGHADTGAKGGKAVFRSPEGLKFDLAPGTLFPVGHTIELIRKAQAGEKFYAAPVFDGSDEEGPIEINSVIANVVKPSEIVTGEKIDAGLLKGKAWNVRMAVFPEASQEERADYEMSLIFHDNGIISDMLIEYDDFSVTQKLVSLERASADSCGSAASARIKP